MIIKITNGGAKKVIYSTSSSLLLVMHPGTGQ